MTITERSQVVQDRRRALALVVLSPWRETGIYPGIRPLRNVHVDTCDHETEDSPICVICGADVRTATNVDTTSSISRQHFIDTGYFLTYGQLAGAE